MSVLAHSASNTASFQLVFVWISYTSTCMCSILSQSAINSNKHASYCDLLNMWGAFRSSATLMLSLYSARTIIRNFSFHKLAALRFWKTARVGAEVMSHGRLFQRRLPMTGKARSPTMVSHVLRFTNCEDDDDWRWSETVSVGVDNTLKWLER